MSAENHMRRAIGLSLEMMRSGKGGPFGAVVVHQGKIIAEGFNQVTSSNDPTAHAEVVAIRLACQALNTFDLSGCELYTSCEPCPMCLGAIYWARPAAVYYANTRAEAASAGFDDSFIYDQVPLAPHDRALHMVHLPHDDALASFEEWRASNISISY
jgi:guanine deaminase